MTHASVPAQGIVVLLLLVAAVHARFPCANPKYTKWTGPSANNSVSDCGWVDWIKDDKPLLASLVVPIAVGILVFVFYPFVMMFRYCCQCCGGSKRRPGGCCCGDKAWDEQPDYEVNAQYSACSVYTTKLLALAVVVGSGVAIILMSAGFKKFDDNYNQLFDDCKGVVVWAQEQAAGIETTMTLPDGSLVPPLNRSFFTDFALKTGNLSHDIDKIKRDANNQFYDLANLIQKLVTYVPIGLLALVPLCALLNIRKCLPGLTSLFFWICCFVFLVVGGVFFITGNVLEQFCLEIDAQYAKQPGIFQYYVVPKCEDTLPFSKFEDQIHKVEVDNAFQACSKLLDLCDSDPNWSIATQNIYFYCGPNLSNASTDCPTFDAVLQRTKEIVAKNNIPANIGPTPVPPICNSVPNENCTVFQCASDCYDSTALDNANTTIKYLSYANRTFTAYREHIRPLMDCNELFNQTLIAFGTCHQFSSSLILVGSGAIVYGAFFVLGIFVLLLGQKRFFSRDDIAQPGGHKEA